MKKIFIALFLFAALVLPTTAMALDLGSNVAKKTAINAGFSGNTTETTFAENLGVIVRSALSFIGVIFMILMVYAGYLWMNARGDESKVDKAQSIIRAAIIGLIIAVGAWSITNFVIPAVLERTAGSSTSTPSGP